MKSLLRFAALIVAIVLALSGTGKCDVPHMMSIQGLLADAAGEPVSDGVHTVVFSIYDVEEDGSALWSEERAVATSDGLFSVVLGELVPIPASIFGSQLWLGIAVGGEPEMEPRQQLTATPYVYRALNADSADFAFTVADNAIGSDQIANRSISLADLAQNGASTNQVIKWNGVAWGVADDATGGTSSGWVDSGSDVVLSNPSDYVGLGVSDPPYKLTVNGSIGIASGGEVKYHLNYYQGGLNFAETGVQDRRIHISDGGNVGIGTANPGAKLGVAGDLKVTGAFIGDVSSSSGSDGAPFPRPAYDSGWFSLEAGGEEWLTHDVGGDPSDYFIDVQGRSSILGKITNLGDGAYVKVVGETQYHYGFYYDNVDNHEISVSRAINEFATQQFRVRIWVVE